MNDVEFHELLMEKGVAFHEARRYADGLCLFELALQETPNCVAARYNVANSLYMLNREAESIVILTQLIETDDSIFLNGCPLQEEPAPFKMDAKYLLFLATLNETESWELAYPFAQQHLSERNGQFQSVFPQETVEREIAALKLQYYPEHRQ